MRFVLLVLAITMIAAVPAGAETRAPTTVTPPVIPEPAPVVAQPAPAPAPKVVVIRKYRTCKVRVRDDRRVKLCWWSTKRPARAAWAAS